MPQTHSEWYLKTPGYAGAVSPRYQVQVTWEAEAVFKDLFKGFWLNSAAGSAAAAGR